MDPNLVTATEWKALFIYIFLSVVATIFSLRGDRSENEFKYVITFLMFFFFWPLLIWSEIDDSIKTRKRESTYCTNNGKEHIYEESKKDYRLSPYEYSYQLYLRCDNCNYSKEITLREGLDLLHEAEIYRANSFPYGLDTDITK